MVTLHVGIKLTKRPNLSGRAVAECVNASVQCAQVGGFASAAVFLFSCNHHTNSKNNNNILTYRRILDFLKRGEHVLDHYNGSII